ncbi:MAG: hydroxyacylglutathione hydrolase [Deltaproteobacteria bacterium RBG_19FT_COMBO_43_11]|nr:MAG: hydroxyacylglutathione hydrolase [Deltaproteobacteria bacterium RBG_19FT_COMBO_43_11]
MLNIEQFRYGDNLAYLVYGETEAMAIDGGAWQEILAFLESNNLSLKFVTNTHQHYDHTPGNEHLLRKTKAKFLNSSTLTDNQEIFIDGEAVVVYRTPGHTNDSICFHAGSALISGDTLFNGTIGNCFSGNLKNFYLSIKRLMALPDETIIYAGHDYVRDSLAFARHLEPENIDIDTFWNSYDPDNVSSTMAEERRINPYLRFNEEPIIKLLQKNGLPLSTEWERWKSLMSIE